VETEKSDTIKFYDNIARDYDEQLRKGLLEKIIRKHFQQKLINVFKPNDRILELSCGTGTDAIFMAKSGLKVTATDISPGMIKTANQKILKENLSSSIETIVMDMENLKYKIKNIYDGAISNFDGLNFIKNPAEFAADLSKVLKPKSSVIFTLLNNKCAWEFIYYILKLNPKKAIGFIRKREKNYTSLVTLYSPAKFTGFFAPYFNIKKITGFGFIIPPDGLIGLQKHFIFKRAEKPDIFLASGFPFRNFCDHYIIEMQLK